MLNSLTVWLGRRGGVGHWLAHKLFMTRVSYYAKRGMIESAEIVESER